jgi:hypothetical protein
MISHNDMIGNDTVYAASGVAMGEGKEIIRVCIIIL